MKNGTLHLTLKKQWFDMIASGEKTEEYREVKEYWTKRFLKNNYEFVEFTLGYPKKDDLSKRMRFKIKHIYKQIGGKEEWGAIKNNLYFVIKLGEKIF